MRHLGALPGRASGRHGRCLCPSKEPEMVGVNLSRNPAPRLTVTTLLALPLAGGALAADSNARSLAKPAKPPPRSGPHERVGDDAFWDALRSADRAVRPRYRV